MMPISECCIAALTGARYPVATVQDVDAQLSGSAASR
jgi:hypothetical protein